MDIYARDILTRPYYIPNHLYTFNNVYEINVHDDLVENTVMYTYDTMFTIGAKLPIFSGNLTFEKWYGHGIHNPETGERVFVEWVVLATSQGHIPVYVTYIRQNGEREKYIINRCHQVYDIMYPGDVFVERSAFSALLWAAFDYGPPDASLSSSVINVLSEISNRIAVNNAYLTDFPEDLRTTCYHTPQRLIETKYKPLINDIKNVVIDGPYDQMSIKKKEETLAALIHRHMVTKINYLDIVAMKKHHNIRNLHFSSHCRPIDTRALPLTPKYKPMYVPCEESASNASHVYDLLSIDFHVTDIEITCSVIPSATEPLMFQDIHVWVDRYMDMTMARGTPNVPQIHMGKSHAMLMRALNDVTGDAITKCGLDIHHITHATFMKTIREEALLEFHPQSGAYEDGLSIVFDFVYAALTAASLSTDITP